MTFPDKIFEIGEDGEKKAFEWLKTKGFKMLDKQHIEKLLDDSEYSQYKKGMGLYVQNEESIKNYKIDQIRLFEDLGCILSDKEKSYLKSNIILKAGDLIGIREMDNKLACFEVKSSKKQYYSGRKWQWDNLCDAKRADFLVYFIFHDYEKEIKLRIKDIKDLWYNFHLKTEEYPSREPLNIITKEEAVENRAKWYKNTFVKMEIVKLLKDRELAMLSHKDEVGKVGLKIRYLIAFTVDYLHKHFERFDFNESLVNMYHSVALLKEIPVFSYNLNKRKKDNTYQDFNENYEKHVIGYNLFIDIDGKEDFKTAYQNAKDIKKILDEFKVPYYVMNSSYKGFHFHIPASYMPDFKDVNDLLETLNSVIYNLKGIYEFKYMDDAVIDLKRICKVPYSYVHDGSICLPLTDFQFENFKKENVNPFSVLRNIHIMNRGVLLRSHGLNEIELKKNVLRFIQDFK